MMDVAGLIIFMMIGVGVIVAVATAVIRTLIRRDERRMGVRSR